MSGWKPSRPQLWARLCRVFGSISLSFGIWLFSMLLKQVVVTETVLLQTLTVHAFLMTRNGIGRKEKERKSTRPPPVSALTASSFSQFQTSVTRNFSSCLLSETIPAIAFSRTGNFSRMNAPFWLMQNQLRKMLEQSKSWFWFVHLGGGGWAGVGVVVPLGIWWATACNSHFQLFNIVANLLKKILFKDWHSCSILCYWPTWK